MHIFTRYFDHVLHSCFSTVLLVTQFRIAHTAVWKYNYLIITVFTQLDAAAFILFRRQVGGGVFWRAAFLHTIINTYVAYQFVVQLVCVFFYNYMCISLFSRSYLYSTYKLVKGSLSSLSCVNAVVRLTILSFASCDHNAGMYVWSIRDNLGGLAGM